ncbi:MAG TPA: hypothetical protein VGU45_06650 [Microvirga sp.]|jgi:hypothetical protein|nr:hypothetical protein [Microvirga sp.]
MSNEPIVMPAKTEAGAHFNVYLPHIQPLMQDLLRTLANLDFEHEMELERLETSRMDAAFKRQIRERLKERHRERREPYVHHLNELQSRATIAKVYAA